MLPKMYKVGFKKWKKICLNFRILNVMIKLFTTILLAVTPSNEDLARFLEEPAQTAAQSSINFYDRIPVTGEEKNKIGTILITMSENSVFQLLFERKFLERLGQEVHHVHPIRFLGTIFSDPRLVNCMYVIRMSGFKWGGFMDGISERLRGEIRAGNVNIYIPGFAEQLNIRAEDIQPYINQRDIEGLVLFLMDRKKSN